MRLPLAQSLQSRDGALDKGAKVVNGIIESANGIIESAGEESTVRPRPGTYVSGLIKTGVSQMLANFYGLRAVIDDYLNSGTFSTIVSGPTQTALTTAVADQPFSYAITASGAATPYMMMKNRTNAWTVNKGGTVAAITFADDMGTNTWPVTSITRSGTVATVKTAADTELEVGDAVTIAGANETDYNGAQTVTGITAGVIAPERNIAITITRSGTTATATSSVPHELSSGTYTIAGANETAYNGSKAITVTSTTQFTYTVSITAMATTATGSPQIDEVEFIRNGSYPYITNSSSPRTDFSCYVYDLAACGITSAALQVGSNLRIFDYTGGPLNGTYAITAVTLTAVGAYKLEFTIPGWTSFVVQEFVDAFLQMPAISSLTYTGTTATTTTASAHGLVTNDEITISGATEGGYNGTFVITRTGATTFTYTLVVTYTPDTPATGTITVTDPASATDFEFTYTVAGSPTTPATGTITAATIGGTVPGIAYINGYFCVMDRNGVIWNSDSDLPTTWGALNFVIAQNQDGKAVALTKSGNYLVALKEWSTEVFYDASNATGSPFSPVDNGFTETGCASGWSVGSIDGAVLFVSQSRQKGRGVVLMSGIEQQRVSTPDVDRILNEDDLAIVHAYCMRLDGHAIYILTLRTSAITLVYDLGEKVWMQWTSLSFSPAPPAGPFEIDFSCDGELATGDTSSTPHTLETGNYVKVLPVLESYPYYGKWYPVTAVDSNTFTFPVPDGGLPDAGGSASIYRISESYFKYTHYCSFEGHDCLLDLAGSLYEILPNRAMDSSASSGDVPIPLMIRSTRLDGGGTQLKRVGQLRLVADNSPGQTMIRWSDDDCSTWSNYRTLDMTDEEPMLRRCGAFRRRSFEVLHIDQYPARFQALELDVGTG